jgi:hypothetical protein
MNPLLVTGTCLVVLALGSYSTATIAQIRRCVVTDMVRRFLTIGVVLDATATAFMIAGSRRMPLTFHGILGYSAFLLMATDLVLIRRYRRIYGISARIPGVLHRYSLIAYFWWVAAFFAGAIVASVL